MLYKKKDIWFQTEMDLDDIEIPDEFCDPLMMTLITNPVELPSNDSADKIIMGRSLLEGNIEENLSKVSNSLKL